MGFHSFSRRLEQSPAQYSVVGLQGAGRPEPRGRCLKSGRGRSSIFAIFRILSARREFAMYDNGSDVGRRGRAGAKRID